MYRAYYVLYHGMNDHLTFQEDPDTLAIETFDPNYNAFLTRFRRAKYWYRDYQKKRFYRNNMKRVRYVDTFAITEDNTAVWTRSNIRKLHRKYQPQFIRSEKIPDSKFIYVGIKISEDGTALLDSEFLVDTDEVRLLDRLKLKHPGHRWFLFDKYASDSICGLKTDQDRYSLNEYYDQGPEVCYYQFLRRINCMRYTVQSDGSRGEAYPNSDDWDIMKTHRDFMIPEFFESMKRDYYHMFFWSLYDLSFKPESHPLHETICKLNEIDEKYPKCSESNVYIPTIYGP